VVVLPNLLCHYDPLEMFHWDLFEPVSSIRGGQRPILCYTRHSRLHTYFFELFVMIELTDNIQHNSQPRTPLDNVHRHVPDRINWSRVLLHCNLSMLPN
jgi:hypothetical protein